MTSCHISDLDLTQLKVKDILYLYSIYKEIETIGSFSSVNASKTNKKFQTQLITRNESGDL